MAPSWCVFRRYGDGGPLLGHPVDDGEAAALRTTLFRVAHGSMHRRADGGWVIEAGGGRLELAPV